MPSIRSALALLGATAVIAAPMKRAGDEYAQRATELYDKVTGKGSYKSKYFSAEKCKYS